MIAKNSKKAPIHLYLVLLAQLAATNPVLAQVEPVVNDTRAYSLNAQGVFMVLTGVIILLFLAYFFKRFTNLKSDNFETFSTNNELLVKVRVLSILAATLFPPVEYYQAEILKLYPADWLSISIIVAIALFSLALSFRKNSSFEVLYALPQFSYYAIYGIILYKLFNTGMLPAMSIEVACLILFSKLIFPKLKLLLYFLGFVLLTNVILISYFVVPTYNFNIYVSSVLQVSIVSVALYLIEGSYNRKKVFGNKILESSNLYILVADTNANFVFVNQNLEQVTGLSQDDLLGDGWWRYLRYNKDVTDGLKKLILDSIKNNRGSNYESTIIDNLGNEVFVSWENTIIEGKFLLAVGKNITEIKRLQIDENKRKEKLAVYSLAINELTTRPYVEKPNLHSALDDICRKTAESMNVERASIWTYDENKIVCVSLYTRSLQSLESGHTFYRQDYPKYFEALALAKVINAADCMSHPETLEFTKEYFPENKICSMLDMPIFINGQLAGVLCCEQTITKQIWDNEDMAFTRSIADFTALTMEAYKRRELEREYRYILNNAGDIIYTTDALGNFEFINKTAASLLGHDIEMMQGKHFSTIIHPDFKEETTIFYLRQFKRNIENTYYEFKVLNARGEEYWVGQNVKLVREKDNPNKVRGFQAIVRDINKQKEAEIALTNSENNFRQINENINEVFYLYNVKTSKYDYISPNCKNILGATQNFFYEGQRYTDSFVIEEDRHILNELNQQERNKEEYSVEFRVNINGEIRWILERSFPIVDNKGKVVKKSGVCSDITEKKEREEQLKQLSLVAQSVSNGVVITDANGHIEWCNNSFLNLFEYSLDEVTGKRPIALFSGPETKVETISEVKKSKLENSSMEILQYTKSGKQKWCMVTNTPILNNNNEVEKYIEIVTDITERKALEREYRYILDNAGDVIYTTNEQGTVEFLNESVTKILGYKPEELINKHFTHIVHPEDKKATTFFYMKQFSQRREDSYHEFRVINKLGGVNWVGQNVKLILDAGNSNKVKGFQSILRDITRQKETELALIASENNFRQINETINDVFYLFNVKENKYDYVSTNSQTVLGVESAYFYNPENNYVKDYVIPKDREIVEEAYQKTRSGQDFDIEYRISVDHEISWIKERSFVIKNQYGEIIKTSGTCSDITQRKMQEKRLLKVNKELSLYSEDLEINNLLKEQLIYTNSYGEIAKVLLGTLAVKIKNLGRATLMLVNKTNNAFDAYYQEAGDMRQSTYNFADIKSYPLLQKGKKVIEYNVDLSNNKSRTDLTRRAENIVSYIALPIMYSEELIGAMMLGFEEPFALTKREIDLLENYTSVLSVVINKLSLQKQLSEKTYDIISSLNYAKGIQQSILPNINLHKDTLKNFMRVYMPKDVVSGDFYVVESYDEYTLIALGDCTGHGVPGAFLTLLGSNFLQRIAVENRVSSPKQILELLDYQVFTMLNRNREETIRDGMEMGLCIYNNNTKKLTFAGAELFLLYYKNGEQIIVPGSKRAIGDENNAKVDFVETSIDLNGTEKFYLFSDGYRDQLGGTERRKRYSRARFLELMNRIKNLPPFQQEYLLKLEHANHKGKHEQTDDISVIGFELK